MLRIDHAQARVVAAVADEAADRRRGAAGARADHDPARDRVGLPAHLLEDRLGDVVVASPVGGALGVGELVHVVAAHVLGQLLRDGIHGRPVIHQVTAAALGLDERDLVGGGGGRHDRHEGQPEQAREVRLRDRRAARRRLDDGRAFVNVPVHERMQEQRTRQPVFQAAGHVTRLVLQVQPNPWKRRKRDGKEVRIGRSAEIRLDLLAGARRAIAVSVTTSHAIARSAVGTSRGTVNVNVDPTPGVLSTEMSPPRMRASWRLSASPRPVPP